MRIRASAPCFVALTVAAWAAVGGPPVAPARAEVFHSREAALRLAFPEADRIQPVDVILTPAQASRVRDLAGVKPTSRLVTAYAGFAGSRALGWAFLDTHDDRTLPETVLLVVSTDGRLAQVRLLAFHEPPEYRPGADWFARFAGAALDDDLKLGHRVDGISGATLSAHAVAAAARRVLAVWQVAFATREAGTALP
jgi:hypothetical protein